MINNVLVTLDYIVQSLYTYPPYKIMVYMSTHFHDNLSTNLEALIGQEIYKIL